MFFSFIGSLILLTFAFLLLNMVVALPYALIGSYYIHRTGDYRSAETSAKWQQITLSVIYAGIIAIMSHLYASQAEYPWVYGIFGFVVTWLSLVENYNDKRNQLDNINNPGRHGVVLGAVLGILAALVAYPLCYFWPQVITIIPGIMTFFTWTIGLMDWLNGFWIVKIIVVILAVGYLYYIGLMGLMGGMLAFAAIKARLTRASLGP